MCERITHDPAAAKKEHRYGEWTVVRRRPEDAHRYGAAWPGGEDHVLHPHVWSPDGHGLQRYERLTGIPALINTSFNVHEEPIINRPHEALKALNMGRVDFVVTQHAVWKGATRSPVRVRRTPTGGPVAAAPAAAWDDPVPARAVQAGE